MNIGSAFSRDRSEPQPNELAERRVAAARKCSAWTEIEDDLVKRNRYLVSASSDKVYRVYAGAAFGRSGKLDFAERSPLSFVVRGGDVLLLEPVGKTWSEIAYARERSQR